MHLPYARTPPRPTPPWPSRRRRRGPRLIQNEGSEIGAFEAVWHGFCTGCLRFAGIVTAPRRKTRSGCWLSSTGWDLNPRVPAKGFKVTSCYFSPLLKHGILGMPSWREDYSCRVGRGRATRWWVVASRPNGKSRCAGGPTFSKRPKTHRQNGLLDPPYRFVNNPG